MALALYDSLKGRLEPFVPEDPKNVRVYVCGPTVYDFAHLGHARCYVIYDVLVRHLRSSGYSVTYCRNITDIDDKIVARAARTGEPSSLLAERFTTAFREDMARLGNLPPDIEPTVTDHVNDIIELGKRLVERQGAYVADGDVYFSVAAFPGYGKLSRRDLEELRAGASGRTDEDAERRKRHPGDFVLWKRTDEDPKWDSPWGFGRPGWHIECSAMAMAHLGESFDLHGGGLDLLFPHHENELSIAELLTGKPFARHWMHNGFVEVDRQKMSKSLGNFFVARDLFTRVEPEAMRYYALTTGYRAPMSLDWTLDEAGHTTGFPQIEDAERRVEYLYRTRERMRTPKTGTAENDAPPGLDATLDEGLRTSLDDDLDTPAALAAVARFLHAVNEAADTATRKRRALSQAFVATVQRGFASIESRLGLGGADGAAMLRRIRARRTAARGLTESAIQESVARRSEARAAKDFGRADAIRAELASLGIELLDDGETTDWRFT